MPSLDSVTEALNSSVLASLRDGLSLPSFAPLSNMTKSVHINSSAVIDDVCFVELCFKFSDTSYSIFSLRGLYYLNFYCNKIN